MDIRDDMSHGKGGNPFLQVTGFECCDIKLPQPHAKFREVAAPTPLDTRQQDKGLWKWSRQLH